MTWALGHDFYARDPAEVARALLGKTLVRKLDMELRDVIVETEAFIPARMSVMACWAALSRSWLNLGAAKLCLRGRASMISA